tara:strand:+ start:106 stop:354 length:249 start_codon:yes stop_codon:yes gene_type:complete
MGTQISIKIPDTVLNSAKVYAKKHGYSTVQDFIRELVREKLFDTEEKILDGFSTYKASEAALAKNWQRPEEDSAWEHLQKEM